jgi:hypothetical protein
MELDSETRGLLGSVLLEAWGGFAADRFPSAKRAEAKVLMDRLQHDSLASLTGEDEALFRDSLAFSLRELGPEEFSTITGYDFELGKAILARLG